MAQRYLWKKDTKTPLRGQVEIPKIGLSEIGLTDPVMNPEEPPKKMSCFELSDHSSNTWEIDSDCTNKCVKLLCRIRH